MKTISSYLVSQNQDLPKESIIAQVDYWPDQKADWSHKILKDQRKLRLIRLSSPLGCFQVLFLWGKKVAQESKAVPEPPKGQDILLKKSELEAFLLESKDKNPLHQGDVALLPAFFLLEACLPYLPTSQQLSFRFLAPAYIQKQTLLTLLSSGQKAHLYQGPNLVLTMTQKGEETL